MKIEHTALSGIYSAQQRFVKSATKLVNAVTPVEAVSKPEEIKAEIQPVEKIPEVGVQSTAYVASDVGLIESSVDMIASSVAYKANLEAFKAWNDTAQTVLSELTA